MTGSDKPVMVKRKVITDFFSNDSNHVSKRMKSTLIQPGIHSVPGLSIHNDFITNSEESDVLAFLDNQQWRTDLPRRVIHYGGTYCLMPPRTATPEERKVIESTIITAQPIPHNLDFVIKRMVERNLFTISSKPTYCIVNEYKGNQGISAHVENFKFISPVCGLTLSNGGWIRFHELTVPDDGSVRSGKSAKVMRTGKKVDVWMPPRSLLAMDGDARTKWQHEIVKNKKDRFGEWRRVSLTFRTEKKSVTGS